MSKQPQNSGPLYAVYAEDTDRRHLLGFATGERIDIEAFFDDRKIYGLVLDVVQPVHVHEGFAAQRALLLAEKAELEARLESLNRKLKGE